MHISYRPSESNEGNLVESSPHNHDEKTPVGKYFILYLHIFVSQYNRKIYNRRD